MSCLAGRLIDSDFSIFPDFQGLRVASGPITRMCALTKTTTPDVVSTGRQVESQLARVGYGWHQNLRTGRGRKGRQDPLHPKRTENPKAKRPKVSNRDLDDMIDQAWDAGWWGRAAGSYAMMHSPDLVYMIKVPSTPSDHRTVRNKRSQFRRAGLNI
jgi:hypothetical protein